MFLKEQISSQTAFDSSDYPKWQTRSPSAQHHWDRQVTTALKSVGRPAFNAKSIAAAAMLKGATNAEVCDLVWRLGLPINPRIVSHYRTNLRRIGLDVPLDREIKTARRNAF